MDSLSLTKADRQVLVDGGWLSANHISAANVLLKKAFPSQNGLQDTCYLEYKLQWNSKPEDFVQILHINKNHWVCVSNKFSGSSVDLYDSLHTNPKVGDSIVRQVCTILASPQSSFALNVVNVQCQQGYSDCGLFAVAMAYDLCAGKDPFQLFYDQARFRTHLESCFHQEMITDFASVNQTRRKKRVINHLSVDVHCICRQPERLPMVCCDTCSSWYHEGCVQIPKVVFEQHHASWNCFKCKHACYLML